EGTWDSNIVFRHIVNTLEQDPKAEIGDIVASIALSSEYNSLCAFLLSPGLMCVWRIYNEKDPQNMEVYEAYYTLYLSMRNGNVLISSEPLDEGNWQLLTNKTFLTIRPNADHLELSYRKLDL